MSGVSVLKHFGTAAEGFCLCRHLEDFAVGVQHEHGDLDVLLDALPSALKVSSLQRQVQVVTDVTCSADDVTKRPDRHHNTRLFFFL